MTFPLSSVEKRSTLSWTCFYITTSPFWVLFAHSRSDTLPPLFQFLTHPTCFIFTTTHTFNGPFSRTTGVGRYQKGKTNLDFTEARDSEWQWHQLGICKSAPRSRQNNHASTSPLSFLQAGCPSCRPTNSVKALKAQRRQSKYILGGGDRGAEGGGAWRGFWEGAQPPSPEFFLFWISK